MTTIRTEDRDKFYESFGRRLAVLRRAAGLTQQAFADEIGLSRVSVANIERGRQIIYVDRLPRWAKVLRCRVMDLLPPQWRTR